jgi:hypothetical protein
LEDETGNYPKHFEKRGIKEKTIFENVTVKKNQNQTKNVEFWGMR